MKILVELEVSVPEGATHYSGNLITQYEFYKFGIVGCYPNCYIWSEYRGKFILLCSGDYNTVRLLVEDMKPISGIHKEYHNAETL